MIRKINIPFFTILTEVPLFFCHYAGSTFICDPTVDEYFKVLKPEHGDEQPRLITLADQPYKYLASVCSASTLTKVGELGKMDCTSPASTANGMGENRVVSNFLKIALRLSHAPSVVIALLCEKESFSSDTSTSDCIQGAMALIKALQVLNKKITVVTQYHAQLVQDSITASATQGQIATDGIRVVEWGENCSVKERLFQGEIHHRLDTVITLEERNGVEGPSKGGLVDTLLKQGLYLESNLAMGSNPGWTTTQGP